MQRIYLYFVCIPIIGLLIEPSTQDAIAAIEDALKAPIQLQHQLMTDLFMLRESVSELKTNLGEVNIQLDRQSAVLHEFKVRFSLDENVIDQCEMEEFFQGIDGKLMKIKQKIQQVINNNDDEHMDKLDKIMHNVRRAVHYSSLEDMDTFEVLKKNITLKLSVFDKQLERLKVLEQKLFSTNANELQTVESKESLAMLQAEINNKLKSQGEKLDTFASFLPLMVNATQSMAEFKKLKKADCNKQKCIAQKILELTSGKTM